MTLHYTAVYRKVPEGYIGFVEELPGANTQGVSLEETRRNLREAVTLVVDANRMLGREAAGEGGGGGHGPLRPDDPVIRETLTVSA